MAPKIPGRAYGSTTFHVLSQRVAPSASAASRWSRGTASRTSRPTDTMKGIDHDREHDAGREEADAVGRAAEQPDAPGQRLQRRLDGRPHDGNEDRNAHEAVDDAGHGRQQFDQHRGCR